MKSLLTAVSLLGKGERKSALWLLPLIGARSFADMLGVAMVFPLLNILSNPDLVQTNTYLSRAYEIGGFTSTNGFIVFACVGFIAIILATAVLKIATVYAVNRWLEGQIHALSTRLLTTYLHQSYEFMLRRHSSELVTSMLSEVTRIVNEVYKPLMDALVAVLTLAFMIGLLLVVDPMVTAMAIVVIGGLYGMLFFFIRKVASRLGTGIMAANRGRHRIAWEALGGGKQVRLLNRERSLIDSYRGPSLAMAEASAKARLARQTPRYVIETVAIGGTVILILWLLARSGGVGSEAMAATLPTLGLFILAGYRMLPAFQNGYLSIVSLRVGNAALESLYKDLEDVADLPKLPDAPIAPLRFHESIELRGVSYAYPGSDTPGLADIDLKIPAGASVGIIGQTGAGKTTLMDLLLGLIEPTGGAFLVDGRRLGHDQLRSWRANVGYVPQEIFLSDASIAQNIAFGVPEAEIDRERVRAAARIAQLEGFILEYLPEGYDTMVGERGVRLSGGQRQRISIARALYTDPEVIAFDEATSALDNNTESLVMEEIAKLAGQKTLLMVAHRLTTVRECDMIVTLERGKVKSVGTYADLVKSDATLLSVVAGGR